MMKTNKELISIIVPVYNVEKELNRCVDSLLEQTYKNIEIILVDDGSTDSCPQICDDYLEKDSRIRVIHKVNGGLSDARNVGLEKANGNYVMYVDSDDYLELDACERLYGAMEEQVDFVAGVIREVNGDKVIYQNHSNLEENKIYSSKEFIIKSIQANEWYAPAVLNLYKREFLISNNLFYKVGYNFEDQEMLPRLCLAANKIVYINYPFYNYIIREGSITTSVVSEKKRNDALCIWKEWFHRIGMLEDKELQRYMYGILIRYYQHTSRKHQVKGWKIEGMDFLFAMRYALNMRERVKVLLFSIISIL